MADLSEEQKREIVEALACHQDVPSIIRAFHIHHGIQLDRKQVGRYDPTRPYFAGGEKWREIFEARRQSLMQDVSIVPCAHKAYRLHMLQEGIDAARAAKNWVLMARLLKQAAEEVGSASTSQGTMQFDDPAERFAYESFKRVREMTPEERRAKVAELFRQAIEQTKAARPALSAAA